MLMGFKILNFYMLILDSTKLLKSGSCKHYYIRVFLSFLCQFQIRNHVNFVPLLSPWSHVCYGFMIYNMHASKLRFCIFAATKKRCYQVTHIVGTITFQLMVFRHKLNNVYNFILCDANKWFLNNNIQSNDLIIYENLRIWNNHLN